MERHNKTREIPSYLANWPGLRCLDDARRVAPAMLPRNRPAISF